MAYDAGVPEPPRSSEAAIRKAMAGDENAYFVPVIVSDGREVLDKCMTSYLDKIYDVTHLPYNSRKTITGFRCHFQPVDPGTR